MTEWEVYPRVACRVGEKAVKLGLARRRISMDEIYERAIEIIKRSRKLLSSLIRAQVIPLPPS
jgi:malic enzyme